MELGNEYAGNHEQAGVSPPGAELGGEMKESVYEFRVGDKVTLNAHFAHMWKMELRKRVGTVMGILDNGTRISVRWEGTKNNQVFYFELLYPKYK